MKRPQPPPDVPAPPVAMPADVHGRYLHWDDLRRREPPDHLTTRAWWTAIKTTRLALRRTLPLRDTDGTAFWFTLPDSVLRALHRVDQAAAGPYEHVVTPSSRDEYLSRSLIEEAITSSQIEGAATTHAIATQMLSSGRAPRTHDERMIANNYRAMEWIRERRSSDLTPAMVVELHRIVTIDALEGANDGAGRLRRADEKIQVVDHADGDVLHVPPPADELPARLRAMCAFANADDDRDEPFVHPVVRSILLHFWLAFDHPFVDGNGRAARALFYWSMLRRGYWLTEMISISRLIKRAPAQYYRSFRLVESDGDDATYFVAQQLTFLVQAIDELDEHIARAGTAIRESKALARLTSAGAINARQIAVLEEAVRDPKAVISIAMHQKAHGIVYETARTDLTDLAAKGFLEQRKAGKKFVFVPVKDLRERLR